MKNKLYTELVSILVPISVSISLKLIDEPFFLYNKDPQNLIIGYIINLELFAEQSKLEMRTKLQDIEVAVNGLLEKIFDQLYEQSNNYSINTDCLTDCLIVLF